MKSRKIEWKESLIKSLVYRALTLVLGTLTVFIITGSIELAAGTALLTETVQGVNYFVYELTWSNISRRKLEKKLLDQIKKREIDLRLDFSSIKELAYQLSQIDTFIPELYLSIQNIFDKMLENEDLKEIHEEIEKYKNYFDVRHSGRKMVFLKEKE